MSEKDLTEVKVDRRMNTRDQITIPKEVCENLELEPKDHLILKCKIEENKAHIEIIPAKVVPRR